MIAIIIGVSGLAGIEAHFISIFANFSIALANSFAFFMQNVWFFSGRGRVALSADGTGLGRVTLGGQKC
ncbi:hypothetical protein VX159_14935 [Dechloromonas sp. ZY10]|uniref:hypothetical protein n=1 Tax=Dechloromonas aquae TaxID=2664436 RepID=UPI003528FA19